QNQRCNRSSTTQGQRTITRDSTREGHVTLRVELTASPFHDEVVVDSNVPAVPLKGATIKINCVGRRVGAKTGTVRNRDSSRIQVRATAVGVCTREREYTQTRFGERTAAII